MIDLDFISLTSWRWLGVSRWLVWPIQVLKACPHVGHMWASAAVQLTATILSVSMTLLIMCTDTSHSAPLPFSAPNDWLVYWIIDSLIHWLTRAKKNWLSDLLTDSPNDTPTGWLSDWQNVCLTDSLAWWLTACYFGLACLLSMDWSIDWVTGDDWLIPVCLIDEPIDRLDG